MTLMLTQSLSILIDTKTSIMISTSICGSCQVSAYLLHWFIFAKYLVWAKDVCPAF